MGEFNGTKGKWHHNGMDNVIQVGEIEICHFRGDLNRDEEYYNSKLIAASPELLEALNVAVGYLSQEVDHQSSLFMSVIDLCNEAIDKALGVK